MTDLKVKRHSFSLPNRYPDPQPPKRLPKAELGHRDRFEPPPPPMPMPSLGDTDEATMAMIERYGYERQLGLMDAAELEDELAVQQEILAEATTGVDRDPLRAADAQWHLEAVQAELAQRARADLSTPLTEYSSQIAGLSDDELTREALRLEGAIADAEGGLHQNGLDALALEARLAIVHDEQGQRLVDDPATPQREYAQAVSMLSDASLVTEQAQVQASADAAGVKLQPWVRSRLALLNAELQERGLKPQPTRPSSHDPVKPDPVKPELSDALSHPSETQPIEAQPLHPYTVVSGDTLWDLAGGISEEQEAAPSLQAVLDDILELNPSVSDPNQISPGDVLMLPIYYPE